MSDSKNSLPLNFGYIHQLLPGVRQDIRYCTENNFVGRRVDGYEKNYSVLQIKAIEALREAQKSANILGYDLLIYDAYRPLRAAADIIDWLKNDEDTTSKKYYPNYTKKDLLSKEYVVMISSHSSGIAVDITLIDRDQPIMPIKWSNKVYGDHTIPYAHDGSLDMYTSFGFFDESSYLDARHIPDYARNNRQLLHKIMTDHGFKAAYNEWWHYELKDHDNQEVFDFIV